MTYKPVGADETGKFPPRVEAHLAALIAAAGGGGGGGTGDAALTVAASDTAAAQKINADYICDGVADDVQIQAAIDAAAVNPSGGGRVELLPGTYNTTDTVSLGHPTDGVNTYRIELVFHRGAKLRWLTVTGLTPILKIESSDCVVVNPWVQGSGSRGSGIGICFGGDTTNYGGRYTKTVYRSEVISPFVTNCNYGICFAIDKTGTSSSGDNNVFGGFITNCVDGVNSAGFVNRIWGVTIAACDYNLHAPGDRNSHMIGVNGCTMNNWAKSCVWLEKDKGSTFVDFWAEHTAAQSNPPAGSAILLGNTTNSTYTAHNTRFVGTTSITLNDEAYAVRSIRSNNVVFENLNMSTNGAMPTSALFRLESTHVGNILCERFSWMTGTVPASWDYTTKSISKDAAATGKCIIKAVSAPAGTTLTNTTYGDLTPTPSNATYFIDVAGTPNAGIYWAKRFDGHIAAFAVDTVTTSGLKAVLESLVADNVHFQFGAGRFHFLDAPIGNESWAGVQDHGQFGVSTPPLTGLSFSGISMDATIISNHSNYTGATDTEPFSFTNVQSITMRDFTVESCGFYKATTDAIDCDQGSRVLIERVRVRRSRSRGIIVDGGDPGKVGTDNLIQDVIVQGRPEAPNLTLVTGGSLTASTVYRYAVSWTDKDLAGAGVAEETKPSEVNYITTDTTNKSVRIDIAKGPYSCTERRIYRAPAGSSDWVRVATVADNTTETYTDTGVAGTSVTMPVSHRSTIPQAGIELLGASGNKIKDVIVDGVGDMVIGASQYGINIVRKGSTPTLIQSDRNLIEGFTVRQSGSHGVRVFAGSDNQIKNGFVINVGTAATRAQSVRVEGTTGASTLRNEIRGVRCIDDQDTTSWTTDKTVNNQITIASGGSPTDTIVNGNVLLPGASATVISDSGVNSKIWHNTGHDPDPNLVPIGADITANHTLLQAASGSSRRVNSSTALQITVPVLPVGSWYELFWWGTANFTLAVSGTTLRYATGSTPAPRARYTSIQLLYVTTTEVAVSGDLG